MPLAERKKITAEEYFEMVAETNEPTELIDGEIVALSAPNEIHQDIVGGAYSELRSFIRKKGGSCKAHISPFDVVIDDTNVVQPDVMVVCDPDKKDGKRVYGAPDFIIEVTSSNSFDDYIRKLSLYGINGVKEYWIVDPELKRVTVYKLPNKTISPEIYTFDRHIPVGIWNDELEICINDLLS